MKNYITEFNQTGISVVNVALICKDWNNKFSISTWINDKEEKYTLLINKRGNAGCKTEISKVQAFEIIENLRLIHIKSDTFRSAGSYMKKDFVYSELTRLRSILKEKQMEVDIMRSIVTSYIDAYYSLDQ